MFLLESKGDESIIIYLSFALPVQTYQCPSSLSRFANNITGKPLFKYEPGIFGEVVFCIITDVYSSGSIFFLLR